MLSVSFFLRTPNAVSQSQLYISISNKVKRLQFPSGESFITDYCNIRKKKGTKELVKKNTAFYFDYTSKLRQIRDALIRAEMELSKTGENCSLEQVRENYYLQTGKLKAQDSLTFDEAFIKFIADSESAWSENTKKKFTGTFNHLKEYERTYGDIGTNKIDDDFWNSLRDKFFVATKKFSNPSTNKHLQGIKQFFKYAKKKGFIKYDIDLDDLKYLAEIEPFKIALKESEVEALINLDLSDDSRLDRGRGFFDDPQAPGSYPYCNRPLGATQNLSQALTWMPKKGLLFNQSVNPSINNFVNGLDHPLGDDTKPGTLGPPYGCPDGNCKTWWTDKMKFFNAVTKLIPLATGNDLQFEEMHYWSEQTPLPITLDNSDKPGLGIATLPSPSETNYRECVFDMMVTFRLDPKDDTTDQQYNGTSCNILIQPKVTNNVLYWINPGGKIYEIPAALAKPLLWLNILDQAVNAIYQFIDNVFHILNDLTFGVLPFPYFKTLIPYPYLQLSGDTFSVPKSFIGQKYTGPPTLLNNNPSDSSSAGEGFYSTAKGSPSGAQQDECWQPTGNEGIPGITPGVSPYIDPNNGANSPSPYFAGQYENYMSADCLMRLFYSKNLLVAPAGYSGNNQYDRYKNKQVKMCQADFLFILLQGNVIYWVDGKTPCIIEKIVWHLYDEIALIDYRILRMYSNNFTAQITIDGTVI